MEHEQLRQWADQQLSGALDDASFARLEHVLATNAAARREYLHYMFLHGELACTEEVLRSLGERDARPAVALKTRAYDRVAQWSTVAITAALLLALSAAPLFWRPALQPSARQVATLSSSHALPRFHGQPEVQNVGLKTGTVRLANGEARIRFRSGADVVLAGPTVLGVTSRDASTLFAGRMAARVDRPDVAFAVETPSVRVVDRGTEFGVSVNARGETEVHCFEGSVEVQARVRLPRHYWSFDDDEIRDHAHGELTAKYTGHAQRGAGLIGDGAASFDNTKYASVACDTLHQASFAVSTGITVEALIAPKWSAAGWSTRAQYDYDEIFRKEDGYNRVLLSFQNDHQVVPTVPAVPTGPCLAFGLNLAGHSYSELDMPLDGQEGRPTLAELKDGQLHHVVATYDSYSGTKAIYIDGKLAFSTKFPAGTMIVSGGAAPAMIGNLPAGIEPFHGAIDEVAYYDFALTPTEISQHYAHIRAGKNYFGQRPGEAATVTTGGWKPTTQLVAGEARCFDAVTGVSLGAIELNRKHFATPRRID